LEKSEPRPVIPRLEVIVATVDAGGHDCGTGTYRGSKAVVAEAENGALD
jgi:hypothetical protein